MSRKKKNQISYSEWETLSSSDALTCNQAQENQFLACNYMHTHTQTSRKNDDKGRERKVSHTTTLEKYNWKKRTVKASPIAKHNANKVMHHKYVCHLCVLVVHFTQVQLNCSVHRIGNEYLSFENFVRKCLCVWKHSKYTSNQKVTIVLYMPLPTMLLNREEYSKMVTTETMLKQHFECITTC